MENKRKYNLTKPRKRKAIEERLIQLFYSVKYKNKKIAHETISQIIKQWK